MTRQINILKKRSEETKGWTEFSQVKLYPNFICEVKI